VVKADPVMPPGVFINEDPPEHTMHRALVSRAFTPGRMRKLEQQIRAFCAACLDPLADDDRFDFVLDLGAQMPVKAIGMLMGIPEADQPSIRDAAVRKLRNRPGQPLQVTKEKYFSGRAYADYVAWRAEHPSDDLVTELLNVEFEDLSGRRRKLSQDELLTFIAVIAGAGVETTGRLFGWIGKVLADHPDQRRPGRAGRQRHAADGGVREPRRASVRRARPLRHPSRHRPVAHVRVRRPLLPRRGPRPDRGPHRPRRGARPVARVGDRSRRRRPRPHIDGSRVGFDAGGRAMSERPVRGSRGGER
jgi:cytochrome P450